MTEADSGAMGGSVSHEFLVLSPVGEDILFYCRGCGHYYRQEQDCPQCKSKTEEKRMIEVGHIFKLGTKYSAAQNAVFLDRQGQRRPVVMGCYGIGVSRLLPAIIEQNFDAKGIIWPEAISPFDLTFIVLDESLLNEAISFAQILEREDIDTLIDDRNDNAGVKFNDAGLIGSPYTAIMGKNYLHDGKIEVEVRKTKERISLSKEEFINFLKEKNNEKK
jgi:prolyl-tRNA synthetase